MPYYIISFNLILSFLSQYCILEMKKIGIFLCVLTEQSILKQRDLIFLFYFPCKNKPML